MTYKYIVYKTTNLINNKIYIGVHRTDIDRADPYIGCGIYSDKCIKKKYLFHKAVAKYGYKNFKRETLFEYPDTEEGKLQAYKKEAELVNREFLKRKDVYNSCLGGKVPSSVWERSVVQYDLQGNFIKVWNSISEATEIAPSQSISECCINKTYSKNWQWRYYDGNTDNIEPAKLVTKVVYQFDLQGNFIAYYKSASEAERITGVDHRSISMCCNNIRSHGSGFYWSFKKRFEYKPKHSNTPIPVACYTDDGTFIKSFDSIAEGARYYNLEKSSIRNCIQGKSKHAGKVRWRYFYGNTSNISSL